MVAKTKALFEGKEGKDDDRRPASGHRAHQHQSPSSSSTDCKLKEDVGVVEGIIIGLNIVWRKCDNSARRLSCKY